MARWRETTRRATRRAISARSPRPVSISWSVSRRSAWRSGSSLEPAADLAVEIPAVVVERLGDRLHVGQGEAAQVEEADHHVRELHAGVVDIVLDLDGVAQALQRAAEHVAEHGVAQVADMGRLVGIDVGVLDHHLGAADAAVEQRGVHQGGGEGAPVEKEVDETGALDLDVPHHVRPPERRGQLLRDRPRIALENAGELHGGRGGQIPQIAAGGHLQNRLVTDAETLLDHSGEIGRQPLFQLHPHDGEESTLLRIQETAIITGEGRRQR